LCVLKVGHKKKESGEAFLEILERAFVAFSTFS